MEKKYHVLPQLQYGYGDLKPYLSEELLRIHHDKHHQAYVNGANAVLEKLERARKNNEEVDIKAACKELSFNCAGHSLHSIFWKNLAPAGKGGGGLPGGALADKMNEEFGSFARFKAEFTKAAVSTEGSGWAALAYCGILERPIIMQIEKHNVNVQPRMPVILVLDVWEHAYYLDYKNERAKFVDAFWNIVNWDDVARRLEDVI
jgi:Fe-Mn family superoxide dismutase